MAKKSKILKQAPVLADASKLADAMAEWLNTLKRFRGDKRTRGLSRQMILERWAFHPISGPKYIVAATIYFELIKRYQFPTDPNELSVKLIKPDHSLMNLSRPKKKGRYYLPNADLNSNLNPRLYEVVARRRMPKKIIAEIDPSKRRLEIIKDFGFVVKWLYRFYGTVRLSDIEVRVKGSSPLRKFTIKVKPSPTRKPPAAAFRAQINKRFRSYKISDKRESIKLTTKAYLEGFKVRQLGRLDWSVERIIKEIYGISKADHYETEHYDSYEKIERRVYRYLENKAYL